MKTALKILITLDLCFFVAGIIMHAMDNQQYEIVTGLGILFLSFIIMPFARTEHSLIFFLFTLRFWI